MSNQKHSKHPKQAIESNTRSFRGRKVWLYIVDGRNSDDLAILDSQGFDRWRGNPGTRAGDLIVMYRSAPFSDIAYVFTAASNAWPTLGKKRWPWKYAVEIADGYRLQRVIKLDELKRNPALRHWGFLVFNVEPQTAGQICKSRACGPLSSACWRTMLLDCALISAAHGPAAVDAKACFYRMPLTT